MSKKFGVLTISYIYGEPVVRPLCGRPAIVDHHYYNSSSGDNSCLHFSLIFGHATPEINVLKVKQQEI